MRLRRPSPAVAVVVLAALLALVGAPPAAQAQTRVSGFIGSSFTDDSDLRIMQPGGTNVVFHAIDWDGRSFEEPWYYGGRVSHYFENTPWLGVGIEWIHYKVHADRNQIVGVSGQMRGVPVGGARRLGRNVQLFEISHGVNYLTADVMGRKQFMKSEGFPDGRVQPYAGVGLGAVLMHPETRVNGRYRQGFEWGGFVYQVFGGVEYGLCDRVSAFAEYKFSPKEVEVQLARGKATTDLNTHHIVIGVVYRP